MIHKNGLYNHCEIFIDEIDESTDKQIQAFLDCPAFQKSHIAIMPDCHAGTGACIGFTMTTNDWIIPNLVGVDVGCGVDAWNLGKRNIDFASLDEFIRENIPHGFSIRKNPPNRPEISGYLHGNIHKICSKTNQEYGKVIRSIGTLGGGNHFIEIDIDEEDNNWLLIHSGSRNFGHSIATHYQKLAKEFSKRVFQEGVWPKLEYLIGDDSLDYLSSMKIAQEYARVNRLVIALDILDFIKYDRRRKRVPTITSVHNYIDMNSDPAIIRKGAISAKKGEQVIIPFNMRDGSLIGIGKGNGRYNFSAPHGAGRVLSRGKARDELNLKEYVESMKGVWTSCVSKNTIDEAPMAYKRKEDVLKYIVDTVEPNKFITPVYNFKDDTPNRRK